jgi:hypothetical protein
MIFQFTMLVYQRVADNEGCQTMKHSDMLLESLSHDMVAL